MSKKHTDTVLNLLSSRGSMTAVELSKLAQISQPTISRTIRQCPEIIRIGNARNARYARTRKLGRASNWNLYQVDTEGRPQPFGLLHSLQQGEFHFESSVPKEKFTYLTGTDFPSGLFPDLPWFLDDIRPQGYIGRLFAHASGPALGIGSNPENWSSDEALIAIQEFGSDAPGNFILGDQAIDTFQGSKLRPNFIDENDREAQFDLLARNMTEGSPTPQSSAGGEQPKFTICLQRDDSSFSHSIVKFSGPISSDNGRRWKDLLLAEERALTTLRQAELPAAKASALNSDERTYLEVERFDRIGRFGRRGVLSLRTIASTFTGRIEQPWRIQANELAAIGWISTEDASKLTRLNWFGHLIGNTDMHAGNASFYLNPQLPLTLCPAYDMLPMLYAPNRAGDLPSRPIDPALPKPEDLSHWKPMAQLALTFWKSVSTDTQHTTDFRTIASVNQKIVRNMIAAF